VGHEVVDKVTLYAVEVTKRGQTWKVLRRYNEFKVLHSALQKRMSTSGMKVSLPRLPKKSIFKSATVISDRVIGFRAYLQVSACHLHFPPPPC